MQTERADNAQHGRWNISHHLPLWPDSQPYKVPYKEMRLIFKKIIIIISVAAICVSDMGGVYTLENALGGQRIIM